MVLPVSNPTKSYWIEAANSPLRHHRSTPDLPAEIDVVIVGSGYTGASAAYWIEKFTEGSTTPSMLMLEARDVCGAATGRNGGQLRPHFYSRYTPWKARFGADLTRKIIEHEAAHLEAFTKLVDAEGLAESTSFRMGETFDAAMTQEAWDRLSGALEDMRRDHPDAYISRACRLITDSTEAEAFTQMKGCVGAVVHPSGQIWAYKFVHELLNIVLSRGHLNLQANTPVTAVSPRDADGRITVTTARGQVRAKAVLHASNRWASHLLPEFTDLIYAGRGTLAAIKAPEGFIRNTGAQHWDGVVNNYHLQLPAPHNVIIIGGAKPLTVHDPRSFVANDAEDVQFAKVPEFYRSWAPRDVVGFAGEGEFGLPADEGGVWSGVYSTSIDSFPFVGPVPAHEGHYIAAGFAGHGMPRILGSTAHLVPLLLDGLGIASSAPSTAKIFPPLPTPFLATAERIADLRSRSVQAHQQMSIDEALKSAKKPFCAVLA